MQPTRSARSTCGRCVAAIVEERESTVIVGEDAKVAVDEFGFLWIEMTDLTGLKDL